MALTPFSQATHSPGPSISVVVPVYNSEATLRELIERTTAVLRTISSRHEFILINDGSRDRSWEVIKSLALHSPNVTGINLRRNFGQHNALLCGVRVCSNELIVTLDDDLQHPPEEIPQLLSELNRGFDLVYGAPKSEQHGIIRNLLSRMVKLSLRMATRIPASEHASAFRIFRSPVRDAFAGYESPYVVLDVLLSWGTTRIGFIKIDHHDRRAGRSGYNFRKLLAHAMNMFTGFSALPLHFVSILGLSLTLVGSFLLVFVLGRYFINGGSVPGFPFLACSLTIFSGAQLFGLGIIGEYLARMHFRMMGKPPYIIGEQTSRQTLGQNNAAHYRS